MSFSYHFEFHLGKYKLFTMHTNNKRYIYFFPALISPLSANPTKWPNTLKIFVGKLPTNCLSVFDHFVKLALKALEKNRQNRKLMSNT